MNRQEINHIKDAVRIEEVAGRYIRLSRRGKLFTGLCPFHDDHHPSLTVDPQKQTFACYACGEHGDVIKLVMGVEKCSFAEALKIVSLGVHFEPSRPTVPKYPEAATLPPDKVKGACEIPSESNDRFLRSLLPYACGNSGLTPSYLDFEVGVSPGLVPKEWYAMRNRIIFPIRDEEGRLIGFAARKQSDDPGEAKYINTAEARGYKKSENLYALHQAKRAIVATGFVFLVEGYKDAITMHAAGFTNTVALCGTALCPGHIALLKKYVSQAVILLDGDVAGRKAAAMAVESLRREGVLAVGGNLPDGEDPDSLFRLLGKEAFVARIDRMRKQLFSPEETALFCRIDGLVRGLLERKDTGKRKELLRQLEVMVAHRAGLSLREGRPATMDWRWL
ncbi:CHC2 zinc finger domain-containing protein [uncultured Parabacteroides sp.]|jgi:DNA primase|uniref:DNA primase n=1 Tax=Alistipes indistinctus TaxID=626932 RepID=UPI0025F65EA5|nr:CHC2 zinc finger domain-containing protein [uncultured Parabacteroides sp.]